MFRRCIMQGFGKRKQENDLKVKHDCKGTFSDLNSAYIAPKNKSRSPVNCHIESVPPAYHAC